jgi:hypothetical protein
MASDQIVYRRSLYGFEMRETDYRRDEAGRKTHEIKQVWQRNHEILRLALLGHKYVDIAATLSISAQTVSNTLNSQLGMEKLSEMRAKRDADSIEVAEEVKKLFPKALEIYEEILYSNSDEVSHELKLKAANNVLMDLGGHKAPTKIQGQFVHGHLTAEDLNVIKERGKEAAKARGLLVIEEDDLETENI